MSPFEEKVKKMWPDDMEYAPTIYPSLFPHLDLAVENLRYHIGHPYDGGDGGWNSLHVTYHPPEVRRLWKDIPSVNGETVRIFLHEILPCVEGKALWHPHPWPSAVFIAQGEYEHGVGYWITHAGGDSRHTFATSILADGSRYEMVDPRSWHYVRPLKPTYTVMVCGKPYDDAVRFPKPDEKQGELHPREVSRLRLRWLNLAERLQR